MLSYLKMSLESDDLISYTSAAALIMFRAATIEKLSGLKDTKPLLLLLINEETTKHFHSTTIMA